MREENLYIFLVHSFPPTHSSTQMDWKYKKQINLKVKKNVLDLFVGVWKLIYFVPAEIISFGSFPVWSIDRENDVELM